MRETLHPMPRASHHEIHPLRSEELICRMGTARSPCPIFGMFAPSSRAILRRLSSRRARSIEFRRSGRESAPGQPIQA
jgi:hypothetical protein